MRLQIEYSQKEPRKVAESLHGRGWTVSESANSKVSLHGTLFNSYTFVINIQEAGGKQLVVVLVVYFN